MTLYYEAHITLPRTIKIDEAFLAKVKTNGFQYADFSSGDFGVPERVLTARADSASLIEARIRMMVMSLGRNVRPLRYKVEAAEVDSRFGDVWDLMS